MSVYGSLVNRLSSSVKPQSPKVGMGVTEYLWSDRLPYEIVEVVDNRHITVRELKATLKPGETVFSDCQEYDYASNPGGRTRNLFLTKKGVWRERVGVRSLGPTVFYVGKATKFYDPSF